MITPSLFDADFRAGAQIISTFPLLCSAADVRRLPGFADASDAEIARRLHAIALTMLSGISAHSDPVWWREDIRDWWRKLCAGEGFNATRPWWTFQRQDPPSARLRDLFGADVYRAVLNRYERRISKAPNEAGEP